MLRRLVTYAVALVALAGAAQAQISEPPVVAPSPVEARFQTLANSDRSLHGARILAWDPTLCRAARQHSREMAELSYFDHRSPVRGLETPADRWEQFNPDTPREYTIGENLFYGSAPDVAWGHRSLMGSREHRANILDPRYSRMGVGVYVSPSGEMWVTEMFVS